MIEIDKQYYVIKFRYMMGNYDYLVYSYHHKKQLELYGGDIIKGPLLKKEASDLTKILRKLNPHKEKIK